ncbi:M28 family peptidase [Massilia sp. Mn16-1_5]|uniref:M28 family peptidase n=1 Tax=Massilia sp. Mn16-1_5 TaxID=2079199 RepID=UPI00109ED986|nr:M28 family peptidase [Massilia sp. Mn16-1_5]THC39993.1 aminopeptidase [Massilia sp. Mn16-1_5]
MRNFFHSHWKVLVALILLILVAVLTVSPTSTSAAAAPPLDERLRAHASAIASSEHNTGTPLALERAAAYIETALTEAGYRPARQEYAAGGQRVRNIEVAVSNVAPGKRPDRIFIVGAHYDSAPGAPGANDNGSGTAAVLELARLLKNVQLSAGTELRFVLFVNEEPPWFMGEQMGSMVHAAEMKRQGQPVQAALVLETMGYYTDAPNSQQLPPGLEGRYPSTGNFIAFVGTLESSSLVREALAAFRAHSEFPAEGLAAPAHTTGVTLSDHSSYNRHGYPALMITDTAFMRYPYYHTAQDTPEKLDYESMARVVNGLAKTIVALAGAKQG